MSGLNQIETEQFKRAVCRSKSADKLMARDLIKLKKPLYKDYLLHLRSLAGSPLLKREKQQAVKIPELPPPLVRNNSSHYYCEYNQLLSLKQFVLLMQESKKRTLRENKIQQREEQKRLRESVSRHIQQNNRVNLRLTSSYVKRVIKSRQKSIY